MLLALPARAAMLLTITQVGTSLQVNGSGSLNTTDLTFSSNQQVPAEIASGPAYLFSGPTTAPSIAEYIGATGPNTFGSIYTITTASSGSGSMVRVCGTGPVEIFVPAGYVSGTALTNSATFANASLSSLEIDPGTYTYTWGQHLTQTPCHWFSPCRNLQLGQRWPPVPVDSWRLASGVTSGCGGCN